MNLGACERYFGNDLNRLAKMLMLICFVVFAVAYSESALSADRLVVKDSGGNTTFKVEDTGTTLTVDRFRGQAVAPGFWLDETGAGNFGALFVLDGKRMQVQRRTQNFGGYLSSPFSIYVDAPDNSFVVATSGKVGFGRLSPTYSIHLKDGAYCTGTSWVDASSRDYKQKIMDLAANEAMLALDLLKPVKYEYISQSGDMHVGFIAEDVPDLVATKDRKGVNALEIVGVLTSVVKEQKRVSEEQQKTIQALSEKIAELEKSIGALPVK